ncbi:MAG: ABC transporter permease, partial [Bacteroidetes bacterium]|nr:ABC transporter permease [Bacteroidota bacterium]
GAAGDKSVSIRSGMVVFQFMISIGLIIGTLVVYQQLQYIQSKEVGYDKEQVMVLPESHALGGKLKAFQQQLLQDPRVLSVSISGYLPAGASYNNNFFVYPNNDVTQQVKTLRYDVDEQYIPTLGMRLLAGRNFSAQRGSDAAAMVMNETAAQALGLGDDALGKVLTSANNQGERTSYRVIGIIADFHFRSLHERISPLVMVWGEKPSGSVIVKASTADINGLLASIAAQWSAYAPEEPFSYSFLDERYAQAYQAEQKLGLILGLFAGLTIFVACLGLFGLALFTAERRTKEIGIRKVLGASEGSIVLLLSREFVKLLLIAFLIASPVAWWAMHNWLQDFAYRISISWWIFIGAGLLALFIALATVSVQALKAALANPVKNLRTE